MSEDNMKQGHVPNTPHQPEDRTAERIAQLSPEKQALLAMRLKARRAQEVRNQPIPRRADQAAFPLSFAQQRMWFLDQWEPESPFYNITSMLRVQGEFDVVAFRLSLEEIIRRHESLRARFITSNGQPLQVIVPPWEVDLPVIDLSLFPEIEKQSKLAALARQEAKTPFDLSRGRLIRASVVKIDDRDNYLFLTMHHIISDGWSIGIFVREALLLYEAFSKGKPYGLPELPIQYADFADWQRKWLEGEMRENQLAYWKEQLGNGNVYLELLTDKPRPVFMTFAGSIEKAQFSKELSESIKSISVHEGVTLFMTLLAAFQVLLYRYTNQEDIRVGTPVSNRMRPELENIIGLFVNTLVMKADFSKDLSFRQLLSQVRETAIGAYGHQDLPFEMLLDELGVIRDLGRSPLFQVLFTLQENPLKSLELSRDTTNRPVIFNILDPESDTAKAELTLFMEDGVDGLTASMEYNTDLFDRATIVRMLGHLKNLLEAIVANPDLSISHLPMISSQERSTLLFDWNDTYRKYPAEECLAKLFEDQVFRSPDDLALIDSLAPQGCLTYNELNIRANRLGRFLRKNGVALDNLVGLYMERSLEMVVATLGIIKAGGAYLPLDLSYPVERMAFMLQDGEVEILLTQSQFLAGLSNLSTLPGLRILCLDEIQDELTQESPEDLEHIAHAENLAYVMYTSGSTGVPKGVAIPQRAISRLTLNSNFIDISTQDRMAHVSNPSFDAATLEIWGAFLNGAKLVVISREIALSTREFSEFIRRQEISIMFLTTSLFNHIVHEAPDAFHSVRQMSFGGEAADVNVVRAVIQSGFPGYLINGYGPTESTTFATTYRFQTLSESIRSIPIGQPLANTLVYVLDRNLQPVPIGVSGELYIGGDGLARNYHKRPDLTTEKFIPNPFLNHDGRDRITWVKDNRLYKTGDLVRYLPDGNIEFLGRSDSQVKLRGLRIELGEIETVLGKYPAVHENVVSMREDNPGEKRLVAYLVPKPESTINMTELRKYLKNSLPDFMIPSAFVILERIPINQNGKVDRNILPTPDHSRPELDKAYVAPRSPVEKYLVSRWQDILGLEKIGVYDDFFELGGDSLKAAILTNRFQDELGETAHVRALFMAPTVADLAMYMTEYYPNTVKIIMELDSDRSGTAETDLTAETQQDGVAKTRDSRASAIPVHFKTEGGIDASKLALIRQIIKPLAAHSPDALPVPGVVEKFITESVSFSKNPQAIFVLSPPRSGSTLLRTMLAGNPGLFSPPELDLLSFNTLAERRETFSGKYSFWLEGVERAIMELRGISADNAREVMTDLERGGVTTKQFYRILQEWIKETAPEQNRRLVDKTPVYSLDMEILKRAEGDFNYPLYIHLTRHPLASVYSFIEAKLDGIFFRYDHPFQQRELAELVWIISHQNILEFLKGIPEERQLRIAFEDIVTEPATWMEKICDFLKIDFDSRMLTPYDGDRMTSGVRPGSQMVGDFKFYLRKDIDPKAADRWKKFYSTDFLSSISWQLAEQLDYQRPDSSDRSNKLDESLSAINPIPRDGDLPLSFAQQRLWFLDQWEPGSPYYNVPVVVRINGRLNSSAMEQTLIEIICRHEVLRTCFPTIDGKPAQIINPCVDFSLNVVDLQSFPATEREARARAIITDEVRKPFDLAKGPLLRSLIIQIAHEEFIVILTMHHIVSDGWSAGVLIREIVVFYREYSESSESNRPVDHRYPRKSPLPALPVQYVDYASWQRQWLSGRVLERQLEYWKDHLQGAPRMLELPTDRPRPAVHTLRGAQEIFTIPARLTEGLKILSHHEEATLFMTLLAGFQVLLSRYSGQDDICIGTPVANRNRAEIEGLIGFFVNTLVLRCDLSGNPDFRNLLEQVKRTAIEAYDHQDLPFEQLVDELNLERNQSHTPLFQVMFTLQESSFQSLKLPGLTITPMQVDSGTSKFDIILTMVEKDDVIKGNLEYNTDLFDRSTILRMIDHYQTLLENILRTPDEPVAFLAMMTEPEKRQVLVEWNRTINQFSLEYLGRSIPDLFESQVVKSPDTIAVEYKDQRLSYFELNMRANQVARYLHSIGVKRNELVGLCVDRSLDSVVGIIGIIKSGAAYLPLDPEYPQDRLAFILQDAGAQFLLTHRQTWEQMMLVNEKDRINVLDHPVFLDADWDRIEKCDDRNLSSDGTMDSTPVDLAYVIYTSGSTGLPKGTLIEHRSAINLWQGLIQKIYSRHSDKELRVSLNAPLPFDASVQEWLMLLSGHTLVIIPQEVRQDGDALLRFIREKEIDVLDCVPSQLKLLLAAGLLDGNGWTPPAVLPGGEAIDLKTWNELVQAPETEFYNMYGPTECTVDSTICRVKDSPLIPSIGLPVNNVQVYILDKNMQPAPIGVPGELVIGGAGVGRGYHKRPDLTLEKFIKNPFRTYLNEEGLTVPEDDRLYRTGDLARYLPDGYLEYLGRIDSQVKLRGFRIELGEIEAVLAQIEGITEAVVIVREDTPGDKQLVAYIVQEGKTEIGVSQLRNYLKNKLPEYMIPSIFVSITELPLTPNRKVDRKALPKPSGLRPELEATYAEPRTEQEEMLVKIWSEILKLDRVGIHDNFFELGGDSILSIQVISRARQAGLILSPRHMFEAQTIAELAPLAGMAPAVQAEQGMVTGKVLLTPIQRWFFEQDFPNPDHWNQAILLSVKIPLRTDLLHDAFRYLVSHHDALRMRFTRQSNSTFWVQENGDDVSEGIIEVIDLGNIKSDTGNPEGDELSFELVQAIEDFAAQAQSSLSLSKGPLLRVVYFNLGNNMPGRLLIVIHHLVIDGVSWRILLEDLQMVYQQLVDGRQVDLPLKTTSYQQWAMALGEFARSSKLTGTDLQSELEFWVDTFTPFLHARLPVDYPDGNNLEKNACSVRRMLGVEKTSQLLHRVSAAFNTEINDVLLTALAKVFQHWTGKSALVVTLEGHGREDISDDVDVTRTVGWFTSIYPAIIETGQNKGTGDLLMAVKEQLRKIPRRGIGYGLLRYLGESSVSGKQEDSDSNLAMMEKIPLGEVSFNYLGQVSQTLSEVSPFGEAHESTGFSHFPLGKRPFLIDIIASVIQDQLRVEWIYSNEIHLPTTIERLADWFITELQVLIDYCLSPEGVGYTPSDFPEARLTQDDLDDLLEELAEDEY